MSDNLAILAGKISANAIRALGAGLGSNLPGRVARKLSPTVLNRLAVQSRSGVVAVSGTNGKSTTSGFIYSILRRAGFKTVHNKQGANLVTGITATIVEAASIDGKLDADYCLFEVDEASLPVVASETPIKAVVVTNLFRDQLDRFGELDTTAKLLNKGIARNQSPAILNADDPNVAQLAEGSRRLFYGIESLAQNNQQPITRGAMELSYCPKCGAEYSYDLIFYGQLGHYACAQCRHSRPRPDICATDVCIGKSSTRFVLRIGEESFNAQITIPGLFNVYNALAASAAAAWLGIAGVTIVEGLKHYNTLFGRSEQLVVNNRKLLIQLIKNPAGASQVIGSAAADPNGRILIAINDNLADGRDISWLWDAEFEQLEKHPNPIVVSGQRADDMAVRLKYAGFPPERIAVTHQLERALKESIGQVGPDQTLWIMPTYTCLLELQKILKSMGHSLSGT
jgi:UDP-N-acetylmuramyl tripeptide synthase